MAYGTYKNNQNLGAELTSDDGDTCIMQLALTIAFLALVNKKTVLKNLI